MSHEIVEYKGDVKSGIIGVTGGIMGSMSVSCFCNDIVSEE